MIELVKRINNELLNRFKLPVRMPTYVKASLPDPVRFKDCWIKVSDDVGGDTAAFSDGADWRRCQDRNVIS